MESSNNNQTPGIQEAFLNAAETPIVEIASFRLGGVLGLTLNKPPTTEI